MPDKKTVKRLADVTDDELLAAWKSRPPGMTMADFAEQYGVTKKAIDSRIYRAREKAGDKPPETPAENVEVKHEGENLITTSTSGRIRTLQQLIEICHVDLSKYTIGAWQTKKWDMPLKINDALEIAELFYVSATWAPKKPEPIAPVIQFIQPAAPAQPKPATTAPASGRGLVIPDAQIGFRRVRGRLDPFHDRRALDIVLQIAQGGEFDHITVLGDYLDMTEWSDKFTREAEFYFTTPPAIYEGYWWLSQFRQAAQQAGIVMIEGNHDARPEIAVTNHLLAMHGLTSARNVKLPVMGMENLLALDNLGIEYRTGYPNNDDWMGPVRLIHGDIARNGPSDTVKKLATQSQETVIQGHIHRVEWASQTIVRRGKAQVIAAFSPGCLCRLDYVVPGHKHGQQWQQGAAVVDWDGDDFAITPIVIQDGRAIYGGRVYRARERLDDLNRDTQDARQGWEY